MLVCHGQRSEVKSSKGIERLLTVRWGHYVMTLLEPSRHREPRYKAGRFSTGHFPQRGGLGPVRTGGHSQRHSSWSRAPLGPSRQCLPYLLRQRLCNARPRDLVPAARRPFYENTGTTGPSTSPVRLWTTVASNRGARLLCSEGKGKRTPLRKRGRTTPSMQAERFPLNPHLPSKKELQRALSVRTSPLDRSGSRSASG